MTGLALDARHRAMLEEMGVRVWLPTQGRAAPESVAAPRPVSTPALAPLPVSVPGYAQPPVPAPVASRVAPPLRQTAALRSSADPSGLDWEGLEAAVSQCQACSLCRTRKNTVFGVGDRGARWMIVGEAPGENEDLQGEPFVGQAGQLLDNMLRALGLGRAGSAEQAVYIANVLKCRPPSNRNPQPEEVLQCEPYLRRQVALLRPRIIVAMGRFAAQSLLQGTVSDVAQMPLGKLRGKVHRYEGVPVIVSYHPAYLLRTPQDKAKAWADLCLAHQTEKTAA